MLTFKNNTVIFENDVFKLNQFGNKNNTPLFVVPPHAGRHGNVTQKLIDKCVENERCVYAFELMPADYTTRNTSIHDLVMSLKKCIDLIGDKPVDVVGVCQGGWLCVILTALNPDRISKLALMAAPIDVKADPNNQITKFCERVPYEWFEYVVKIHSGIQPGVMQWLSFAMSSPVEVFFGRHMKKFFAILNNDQKLLDKLNMVDEWYDSPQDLAGVWFLEAIHELFIYNKLIKSEMVVNNKIVELSKISCPLYLYAGGDDEITSYEQLYSIKDYVLSERIYSVLLPDCGHTRVFTGKSELETFRTSFLN